MRSAVVGRALGGAVAALALLLFTAGAEAASESANRDAGRHFQRGVDLYGEGDYRGALVEFKRAYDIWPRANVLYDIGQTESQLGDYAGALTTMERYLHETGPNAAHRGDVEATLGQLRNHVGRVALDVPGGGLGCEVLVDERPAGVLPLDGPLLVSMGARQLAVHCGGIVVHKHVEVAAGQTVPLTVELPAGAVASAPARPRLPPVRGHVVGWSVTGALVGLTVGAGVAALVEAQHLSALRASYPVDPKRMSDQRALTTGLAISADTLGALSVAAAGVSTWLTVKYARERKLRVGLNGWGVKVAGSF